jgi:hypothetical protein
VVGAHHPQAEADALVAEKYPLGSTIRTKTQVSGSLARIERIGQQMMVPHLNHWGAVYLTAIVLATCFRSRVGTDVVEANILTVEVV